MTRRVAVETGRITLGPTVRGCTGFYLAMYGDGSGAGPHGYFTTGRGLSVLRGQGEMHTPEDVTSGTPLRRVEATYDDLEESGGVMTAAASADGSYFFVGQDAVVAELGLSLNGDPCMREALR